VLCGPRAGHPAGRDLHSGKRRSESHTRPHSAASRLDGPRQSVATDPLPHKATAPGSSTHGWRWSGRNQMSLRPEPVAGSQIPPGRSACRGRVGFSAAGGFAVLAGYLPAQSGGKQRVQLGERAVQPSRVMRSISSVSGPCRSTSLVLLPSSHPQHLAPRPTPNPSLKKGTRPTSAA
jgi:hypothetical protein